MNFEGDNMMDVKRKNRSAALRTLHEMGAMSRKRLAEHMKLTPAAITKIVSEMIEDGIVREGTVLSHGGAGRREILVEINEQAGCTLGIFIHLRQAILSAVRLDGSVLFSETLALEERAPAEKTVKHLCTRLMTLVHKQGLKNEEILGVGVAVRGTTTLDAQSVRNSHGALDTEYYPLRERVEHYTHLPTVMANNVRALFAAQLFLSRDTDLPSQFFLRCEYGIGASMTINNEVWRGCSAQCAEIGHIPVIKRGGKPCSCGKSGCLETIAAPSAIREEALAICSPEKTPLLYQRLDGRDVEELTIEDVLEAAAQGDAAIASIVEHAVTALGQALKSVIYLVDPKKIVLYGRLFENNYYLAKLFSEMQEGVDAGHMVMIEKSRYNLALDECAAPLLAVRAFFNRGGMPA